MPDLLRSEQKYNCLRKKKGNEELSLCHIAVVLSDVHKLLQDYIYSTCTYLLVLTNLNINLFMLEDIVNFFITSLDGSLFTQ